MSELLVNKKKSFLLISLFFGINGFLFSQDSTNTTENLFKKINYAINSGQENVSDSLQTELSSKLNRGEENKYFEQLLLCLRGLHYAYFHYDYLLDSIYTLQSKTDNSYISHIQKLIESEHYFNNADWEKTIDLSFYFLNEELSMDDKDFSTLFYAISLSNLIISRDNLLLNIDSVISINYSSALNILFKNSVDSLNNGILIKLYWACCVINSFSENSKKLKEILLKKAPLFSIEDLAYFESVISTYLLYNHSDYERDNNLSLYDKISQEAVSSNKGYFIRNKWFQHLLNFGLFSDNENQYFNIELKYNQNQKNISPYFIGQRLIQFGIYYGSKNNSISSSFFSRFYEFISNDSNFKHYNYRLLNYAIFEDHVNNFNPLNKSLSLFVEKNKLINKENSKVINFLYIISYINELALNDEFNKIDSLTKYDTIISINRSYLLNIPNLNFFNSYHIIRKSFSLNNYLKLKRIF